MQTYQSHSDGRRSRAGRGPVQTAGKPLVSSGEAAFAIFLTRFANQIHKVFLSTTDAAHASRVSRVAIFAAHVKHCPLM